MDLSDISGDGIIFEEDRKSVKKLLELILEIIYTMNDANGSEQNEGLSNNEKILSDSNMNNDDMNSELNYGNNANSNNNRNSRYQNQILTSHSNSNFYVNESRDSQLVDMDEEKGMKSTNRSNKKSNSVSGSVNNIKLNNNIKNSKSNGFSNSNINSDHIERNNENFSNQNVLSNRNENISDIGDHHKHGQYYELADHQLSNSIQFNLIINNSK